MANDTMHNNQRQHRGQSSIITKNPLRFLSMLFMAAGGIGLIASFVLTYDKIQVLLSSTYEPSCNISPILSCGSVMATEQASILGVPNTIFGLIAFSALTTLGIVLFAGARPKPWFWRTALIVATIGVMFMHYLFFQGVFRINAICPWCFVVWMITIPVFWYIALYVLHSNAVQTPVRLHTARKFVLRHHGDILLVWYLGILAILVQHFWYYWETFI